MNVRTVVVAGIVLALGGCRISPLTNKISVGQEPFVVLVGQSQGNQTDLFAGSAGGGEMFQLTFTREPERSPMLDPTGVQLAFLREDPRGEVWLVVMNLFNTAERETRVPTDAGPVERVAWSHDGTRLHLRTGAGLFSTPAPPARLALAPLLEGSSEAGAADSTLSILLGDPPFAAVVSCPDDGLCIRSGTEDTPLAVDGRDPLRWTGDSVGYLVDQAVVVRPLGPGRSRRLEWSQMPAGIREPTHFQPIPRP